MDQLGFSHGEKEWMWLDWHPYAQSPDTIRQEQLEAITEARIVSVCFAKKGFFLKSANISSQKNVHTGVLASKDHNCLSNYLVYQDDNTHYCRGFFVADLIVKSWMQYMSHTQGKSSSECNETKRGRSWPVKQLRSLFFCKSKSFLLFASCTVQHGVSSLP